jgi:hypothetical protein
MHVRGRTLAARGLIALTVGALGAGCTGELQAPTPYGPEPRSREEGPPRPGEEFLCRQPDAVDPGPRLVRRLTVTEYAATVQALLGVDLSTEARAQLPGDLRADGFTNTAASLIVTLEHVQAYEALAALAVDRLEDFDGFVAAHADCTRLEDECERSFIQTVGSRLFRGPVAPEEERAMQGVFQLARDEGDSFTAGARFVLEAMLQSPRFLYRVERETGDGEPRRLAAHELAARLSYLVWNAPPDDALRVAADAGQLSTDAQIEAQMRRMLADPRARGASRRYLADWLDLSRLDALQRSEELFPDWDPALARAMQAETLDTFEHLVWEERRPLLDVFNAQVAVMSPELAAHYGVADAPVTDGVYDLSSVESRGGLLTQGALLAIGGDESSMVSRGLFLLGTFLCGSLEEPPPGVDTTPPVVEPGLSQRFYAEERVDNPACGGCHRQMEPISYGLERFDATGRYQLEDHFGNALGEDGWVVFPGEDQAQHYESTAELLDLLAASERVAECMTLTATQYALGRPILGRDGCTMAEVRERFLASDRTYQDLLVAIALSPGFRLISTRSTSEGGAP